MHGTKINEIKLTWFLVALLLVRTVCTIDETMYMTYTLVYVINMYEQHTALY